MAIAADEQDMIRDILNILRITDEWMDRDPIPVLPGSAFAEDDSRLRIYGVNNAVVRSMNVAIDHLHCFRMALTGQGEGTVGLHTFAPFTLVRGAIENAATAVWIALPDTSDHRLLRCLRYEMASLGAEADFLELAGRTDDQDIRVARAENQRHREQLLKIGDDCNTAVISRGKVKNKPSPSHVISEAGKYIAAAENDELLAPILWRLCSGVAHGDPWPLRLFPLEIVKSAGPGVSQARYTAATSLVHTGVKAARLMILVAMRLAIQRSSA